MSQVLVTDTKLTDIANSIRNAGNTNDTYTLSQMPDAILNIPSYELLFTTEATLNNITSTTATNFATYTIGSKLYTSDYITYIQVRDKIGPRPGYFYGGDWWAINIYAHAGETTNINTYGGRIFYINTDGTWGASTTVTYGLYPYTLRSNGTLVFRTRYNSTVSLTLDGTYIINVYNLKWPNNEIFFKPIVTT